MKKMFFMIIVMMIASSCSQSISDADTGVAPSVDNVLFSTYAQQPYATSNISLISNRYVADITTMYVYRNFKILVKNIGYEKKVTLCYQPFSRGAWQELSAVYKEQISSDWEIWTVDTAERMGWPYMQYIFGDYFAVKYEVNGATYWDNNNGSNYPVQKVKMGANFNVMYHNGTYDAATGAFNGSVYVRNLDPTKKVTIVYTTDNWVTTQVASAAYESLFPVDPYFANTTPDASPDDAGIEYWTFSLSNIAPGATVKLAVSYEVVGKNYWDNNCGANYTVTIPAE